VPTHVVGYGSRPVRYASRRRAGAGWFLLCWLGYTYYADGERGQRNLTRVMQVYRSIWPRQMLERDNRMVDTQIIAKDLCAVRDGDGGLRGHSR
jgi:Protein of unknown function, DUF599